MSRFPIIIPVLLAFTLLCVPARADWCRTPGGGLGESAVVPCDTVPSFLENCGTFKGETVWCYPAGGARSKSEKRNSNTTALLVGAGVGLAVVAVAWYFFKKAPSKNNPGQVSLASF